MVGLIHNYESHETSDYEGVGSSWIKPQKIEDTYKVIP